MKFHLHTLATNIHYGQKSLWCVGRTPARESVACRVVDFNPSFLLHIGVIVSEEDLVNDLNELFHQTYEKKPFYSAKVEHMVNLIGFTNNKQEAYFRVYIHNAKFIKNIAEFFDKQQHLTLGGRDINKASIYHLEWDVEQQFMHQYDIKFGDTIEISDSTVLDGDLTSAKHEYDIRSFVVHPSSPHPWLCCGVTFSYENETISIAACLWWDNDGKRIKEFFFSSLDVRSGLCGLRSFIRDVDVIVFDRNTLESLTERAAAIRVDLGLSLFAGGTKVWESPGGKKFLLMRGRERLCIEAAVRTMNASPPLDQFTLEAAVTHPNICRDPCTNVPEKASVTTRLNWLVKLEKDNHNVLSKRSMARASSTVFTRVVEGGQQRKVWNTLLHHFYKEHVVINKTNIEAVLLKRKESSFPSQPPLPNTPIQKQNRRRTRTRTKDLFGKVLPTKAERTAAKNQLQREKNSKKFKGGYVTEPRAGFFHRPEEGTVTLDFKSMYPSIIVGYRLCYMNVVTDAKWFEDPDADFMYIPIGENTCFAVITRYKGQLVRTMIPGIMSTVMDLRKEVKKRMKASKKAGDVFQAMCLDFQQLSCKVFQNSIYGFFGVRRNSLLGYPLLMAGICAIGQYMIKLVTHLALRQKCYVVYGDTDSVMVQFPNISTDGEVARKQLFERSTVLAEQCTTKFPMPNELEVETLKFSFLLLKRKNYGALELEAGPGGWEPGVKTSVKGLTFKKRDRCIWVRLIGHHILKSILHREACKIMPFVRQQIQRLLDSEVPYADLTITCWIKDSTDYKGGGESLIQVRTARKVAYRQGVSKLVNMRLGYVVLAGPTPLYTRGEETKHATEHRYKVDLQYYIEKQLATSISSLLTHHHDILDEFQSFVKKAGARGRFISARELV
jgi:hypothetical protein